MNTASEINVRSASENFYKAVDEVDCSLRKCCVELAEVTEALQEVEDLGAELSERSALVSRRVRRLADASQAVWLIAAVVSGVVLALCAALAQGVGGFGVVLYAFAGGALSGVASILITRAR